MDSRTGSRTFAPALWTIGVLALLWVAAAASGVAPAPDPDLLLSRKLVPSGTMQKLQCPGLTITVPGGAVRRPTLLTVRRARQAPAPSLRCLAPLSAYSLALDDPQGFAKDVLVEIAFDPTAVVSDVPVASAITAAYWSAAPNAWVLVPVRVDAARRLVSLRTRHFSLWRLYYLAKGLRVQETAHFNIVYDPARQVYVGKRQEEGADFAQRVGAYFEHAYSRYVAAGFAAPGFWQTSLDMESAAAGKGWRKLWAFVNVDDYFLTSTAVQESVRSGYTGNIYLPGTFDDFEDVQHDTAHELFHVFQNQATNIVTLGRRHWWVEATADYAADQVAWEGGTGRMGLGIRPNYLEESITCVGAPKSPWTDHEYHTAHFVRHLARGGADFAAMCAAIAGFKAPLDVLMPLDKHLRAKTKKGLADHYTEFAEDFLFGAASPLAGPKSDYDPLRDAGTTVALPAGAGPLTWRPELKRGCSAKLWAILAPVDADQGPRRVRVQLTENPGAGAFAYVYLVKRQTREAPKRVGTLLNPGDETTLEVAVPDLAVCVLAFNCSYSSDRTLALRASDASVALALSPISAKVRVGQPVTFTGVVRGTPPPGAALECDWSFGDGGSGTSALKDLRAPRCQASHGYGAKGKYTVRATLYAAAKGKRTRLAAASAAVEVEPKEKEEPEQPPAPPEKPEPAKADRPSLLPILQRCDEVKLQFEGKIVTRLTDGKEWWLDYARNWENGTGFDISSGFLGYNQSATNSPMGPTVPVTWTGNAFSISGSIQPKDGYWSKYDSTYQLSISGSVNGDGSRLDSVTARMQRADWVSDAARTARTEWTLTLRDLPMDRGMSYVLFDGRESECVTYGLDGPAARTHVALSWTQQVPNGVGGNHDRVEWSDPKCRPTILVQFDISRYLREQRAAAPNSPPPVYPPIFAAVNAGASAPAAVARVLRANPKAVNDRTPPDRQGYTPLHAAAGLQSDAVARLLLAAGADANAPDAAGRTPLHWVGSYGSAVEGAATLTMIRLLVSRGARVGARDRDGRTPLHTMVERDRLDAARALLAAGADANTRDRLGRTPLHLAARYGRNGYTTPAAEAARGKAIAEALVARGAQANARDVFGHTPLHLAAMGGGPENVAVARTLLAKGADVNARGEYAMTPLHWVTLHRPQIATELATLLVGGGADVNAVDEYGRTPLSFMPGETTALTKLLRSRGAHE